MSPSVRPHPHDHPTSATACSATVRYVTEGLLATIEAYTGGTLPLYRFAWELAARIDILAELGAPTRTVTRLRWLSRSVELLPLRAIGHGRTGGRADLTEDEENSLTVTLVGLRRTLGRSSPSAQPGGASFQHR